MPRHRLYATAAERQQAYRRRLAAAQPRLEPSTPPSIRASRPPSRPARLSAIGKEAEKLCEEYQSWLASLPDSLADTDQAHLLEEAVEQLQAVVDLLADIQPPRGFGRD